MQVRYVIANVTTAEERERIVIFLEEEEEASPATRQSATRACG